jgi:hypothetical protein
MMPNDALKGQELPIAQGIALGMNNIQLIAL